VLAYQGPAWAFAGPKCRSEWTRGCRVEHKGRLPLSSPQEADTVPGVGAEAGRATIDSNERAGASGAKTTVTRSVACNLGRAGRLR